MHLLLPHMWINRFSQISIISHKRNSNRYNPLKDSFEASINFKRAKGLEGYSHVIPGKRKGLFVTLYICHFMHMEFRGQGVEVPSLPPCGSRDGLRLGGECLYLLSHLRPLTFLFGFCFETVLALNARWSSISAYQLLARRLRHQAALRKHIFSITVPSSLEPGIFFKGPFTMFAHKGVFLRFGISSH